MALIAHGSIFGGAEQFLRNLIAELPARADVTLLGTDAQVLERITVSLDRAETVLISGRFLNARRELKRLAPNVVEVNLCQVNGSRALVAAAISCRIPTVLVDHGPAPGLTIRGRTLQRLWSHLVAARVSVAELSAREVERHAGLRHRSVKSIRNGVPEPDPCGPPPEREGLVVGVLARLDPVKGIDLAIRAVAQLPDVRLRIAGAGEQRDELVELAARLGASDRIEFVGEVRDPHRVMCSADIVLIPSRSEGLPLVLLEAMFANRPLIVTNVGSMAEVVTDHVNGLVVPPDDVDALVAAMSTAGEN